MRKSGANTLLWLYHMQWNGWNSTATMLAKNITFNSRRKKVARSICNLATRRDHFGLILVSGNFQTQSIPIWSGSMQKVCIYWNIGARRSLRFSFACIVWRWLRWIRRAKFNVSSLVPSCAPSGCHFSYSYIFIFIFVPFFASDSHQWIVSRHTHTHTHIVLVLHTLKCVVDSKWSHVCDRRNVWIFIPFHWIHK